MKKKLYLCIVSFHHASRQINEPGWNFCFKETSVAKQMLNKGCPADLWVLSVWMTRKWINRTHHQ